MERGIIQLPNGTTAIFCSRNRPRCHQCSRPSEFQCDFPVGRYKSGKKKDEPRTCDRHICSRHAKHGKTQGVDFCAEHYPIALAAYKRRMNIK